MCILREFLLTLITSFYFLIPPCYCSVACYQLFPSITLLAVILTNRCHPSVILAPAYSLYIAFFVVHILSDSSGNCSAFLAISSWNYCLFAFTSTVVYLQVLSHLYISLPLLLVCLRTLVCWLSVHIRQRSVVPTSSAHTRTSVFLLLRGAIVNRTYGILKNLYI